MPLPDNKRERGSTTQTTQQSVAPTGQHTASMSNVMGGATNVGPQLQINPNQARIVKTGGELAQAFAGLAQGVQKGIAEYQKMEKMVEEVRYNEWETEMIRQSDAVNGDPQKMKTWLQSNEFKAGRHTSKRYAVARAGINGKAYADDQNDLLRDILNKGATMPTHERSKYYREQLKGIDEQSPIYGKLDAALRSDVANLSAQNRKNSLMMYEAELTAETQDATMRIIDAGANPDIIQNDIFKNILRARNMGIVTVDDKGQIEFNGQIIDPNALSTELNGQIIEAMEQSLQGGDPDRNMSAFKSIGMDEGAFAEARRKVGEAALSGIDARARVLALGISGADDAPGSMIAAIDDSIPPNLEGQKRVDAFRKQTFGIIKGIIDDPKIPAADKIDTFNRLEQALGDDYAAAREFLKGKHGMEFSDAEIDDYRRALSDARSAAVVQYVDKNAPDPNEFKTYEEYHQATRRFMMDLPGYAVSLEDDTLFNISYQNEQGEVVKEAVPATDWFRQSSNLMGRGIQPSLDGVSLAIPGDGVADFGVSDGGAVTYTHKLDNGVVRDHTAQLRKANETGRQKAVAALRARDTFYSGSTGDMPAETALPYFEAALAHDPELAIDTLMQNRNGAEILHAASAKEDMRTKIAPVISARLSPAKYIDKDGKFDYESYKEAAQPTAFMLSRMNWKEKENLLGLSGAAGMSRDMQRQLVLLEHGDQIFGVERLDQGSAQEHEALIDSIITVKSRSSTMENSFKNRVRSALDVNLDDLSSGAEATYDQNAQARVQVEMLQAAALKAANAQLGTDFESVADLRATPEGNRAYLQMGDLMGDFGEVQLLLANRSGALPTGEAALLNDLVDQAPNILAQRSAPIPMDIYEDANGRNIQQVGGQAFLFQMQGNEEQAGSIIRGMIGEPFFDTYPGRERGDTLTDTMAIRMFQTYVDKGPEAAMTDYRKAMQVQGVSANNQRIRIGELEQAFSRFDRLIKPTRTLARDVTGYQRSGDSNLVTGMYEEHEFNFTLNPDVFVSGGDNVQQILQNFQNFGDGRQTFRMRFPGQDYSRVGQQRQPFAPPAYNRSSIDSNTDPFADGIL